MKRLVVLAAGLVWLAACGGPRYPVPDPPTLEAFSAQGAPPPRQPGKRVAADARSERRDTRGHAEAEHSIYVRTSDDGSSVITNTDDAGDAGERPRSTDKLYRWRDANGREHITDTPPPQGAELLGETSRKR